MINLDHLVLTVVSLRLDISITAPPALFFTEPITRTEVLTFIGVMCPPLGLLVINNKTTKKNTSKKKQKKARHN